MKTTVSVLGLAAAVLGLTFGPTGSASAGLIIKNPPTISKGGDPIWVYNFQAFLQPNTELDHGDYFVIYDVRGVTANPFHREPQNLWTFNTASLGINTLGTNPPGITPPPGYDTPGIRNVIWSYDGPTIEAESVTTLMFLGTFSVQTPEMPNHPPLVQMFYGAQTHGSGETKVGNGGFITPQLAPEPSTVVLAALGAVGLLAWRARPRRRA